MLISHSWTVSQGLTEPVGLGGPTGSSAQNINLGALSLSLSVSLSLSLSLSLLINTEPVNKRIEVEC